MKRFITKVISLTIILSLTAQFVAVTGQSSPNASETSYRQAREILNAGIDALGGLDFLRSIQDFTLKETGRSHHVHQSAKPFPPFSFAPREETLVIDFKRNRSFYNLVNNFPGQTFRGGSIINGTEGYNLDLRAKTATTIPNPPAAASQRGLLRKLPHFVLLEALERATTLRYLGEENYKNKKQQVVTFARSDGQQTSLYFDARTKLLTKFELLYTDNAAGDSRQEHIFTGYRRLENRQVPTGRLMTLAGHPWQETEYAEVRFNTQPAEDLFKLPGEFEKLPASQPLQTGVSELAPDVYLYTGASHNALFVAFNDHVLVVDAPEPSPPFTNYSENIIARIKEKIPGKPIRYAVLTHHHADHAGGARAFVAEGATIVTTPNNQSFIEQLLTVPFTFAQDAFARNPRRRPTIEILANKRRTFRDDKHQVELYDIGPSPHADEMIVVYLPQHKILFQSDLFFMASGGAVTPAQDLTAHFAGQIQKLNLDVAKIAGGHGRVATIEELRESLKKRSDMTK